MLKPQSNQPKEWEGKRRSRRLALIIPVIAYRTLRQGPPFHEGTNTQVVSAHGALISMATKVVPKQRLMLKNALTGQELECRIIFTDKNAAGPTHVGIEFLDSAPNFWCIAFPPTDWPQTQ